MTTSHAHPYNLAVEMLTLADATAGTHRAQRPTVEHFDGRPCLDSRIVDVPGGPSVCWTHDRRVYPAGTRARTAATRRH